MTPLKLFMVPSCDSHGSPMVLGDLIHASLLDVGPEEKRGMRWLVILVVMLKGRLMGNGFITLWSLTWLEAMDQMDHLER